MNEVKIDRNRYYPWCYLDLKINLIPISWPDRKTAKYTLSKCFGNSVFQEVRLIKGKVAIRRGWSFGKNVFYNPSLKKKDFVRKFYIPPEYKKDRSSRRWFLKKLYNSSINRYYFKTYG
ncbi:MAG: hypothetical protein RSC49_02150 [Clostridium sp.]